MKCLRLTLPSYRSTRQTDSSTSDHCNRGESRRYSADWNPRISSFLKAEESIVIAAGYFWCYDTQTFLQR